MRDGRELPEVGHQPRVRIATRARRRHDLAAEVVELRLGEPALEERARVDAAPREALEDLIADAAIPLPRKKWLTHFIEPRRRRVRRQVAAEALEACSRVTMITFQRTSRRMRFSCVRERNNLRGDRIHVEAAGDASGRLPLARAMSRLLAVAVGPPRADQIEASPALRSLRGSLHRALDQWLSETSPSERHPRARQHHRGRSIHGSPRREYRVKIQMARRGVIRIRNLSAPRRLELAAESLRLHAGRSARSSAAGAATRSPPRCEGAPAGLSERGLPEGG